MIKKLKILWIKWRWVLFGNKPYKEVKNEIMQETDSYNIKETLSAKELYNRKSRSEKRSIERKKKGKRKFGYK